MKTKESIAKYNKEYFARPEVIARAKVRNAQRRGKRKEYKKTERGKEAENRYRRKNFSKDEVKSKVLFKRYGITISDYNDILLEQKGVCAICGVKSSRRLHTDHCHKTKKVRGLLCSRCNMALGLMKDNIEFLLKAVNYLQK